jgi:hypothetical protein
LNPTFSPHSYFRAPVFHFPAPCRSPPPFPAHIFQPATGWAKKHIIEGSLEVKLPTIWTDEKQSREEAERRERLEERRLEEKE